MLIETPLSWHRIGNEPMRSCEYRFVSGDGRIVCGKIVEGDTCVSRAVCRCCPVAKADCTQLRFTLRQTSPSPLIVRYNGHTQIWGDEDPRVEFQQAACAARVVPIEDPRVCAACTQRQPATREGRTTRKAHASPEVPSPPWPQDLAAAGA